MANDLSMAKFEALVALTGVRTDMADMEWRWLASVVSPRTGSIHDMWQWAIQDTGYSSKYDWLASVLGYRSDINAMWLDYWTNYFGLGFNTSNMTAAFDAGNWGASLPAWGAEQSSTWTAGTGWSQSGNGGTHTSGGGAGYLVSSSFLNAEVGKLYALTYTVTGYSGSQQFQPDLAGAVGAIRSANGTFTDYITAPKTQNPVFSAALAIYCQDLVTITVSNVSVREVILTRGGAALGANLAASGYTMSVNGGTGTATESPTGQLNLTGDGTNPATADKSFTTVVGRKYRYMFTGANSAGSALIGTTQGSFNIISGTMAVGFNSYEFTATTTTTWVRFAKAGAALATITAIEVRELPATGAFPKRAATFDEFFAFTASSTTARTYVAQDGAYKNDLAANAPRRDWRNGKQQFRLEDARTNVLSNNSMTGAVLGVIGSGGSMPTGWAAQGVTGITHTVVALGTELGLPYIDIRISGTNTSGIGGFPSIFMAPNGVSGVAATSAQTWASTFYAKLVAGAVTGNETVAWNSFVAAGAYLTTDTVSASIAITSSIARFGSARTPSNALTAFIQPIMNLNVSNGAAIDVTYRIYAPQLELGSFASDPILTTSAAVPRAIETARFSPLVEAILQRAAYSLNVKAVHSAVYGDAQVVGFAGTDWPLAMQVGGAVNDYDGSTGAASTGGTASTTAFGVAESADSAGRSITRNGATLGTTTAVAAALDRSLAYLARNGSNYRYGDGLYDFVGISPERLTDAQLQALAVAD